MCEITPFGIYCKPCCCSDLIDVTGIAEEKQKNIEEKNAQQMKELKGDIKKLHEELKKEKSRSTSLLHQLIEVKEMYKANERELELAKSMFGLNAESFEELSEGVRNTRYDGVCSWKIENFELRRKAASGVKKRGVTYMESHPFYTSRDGYKMCVQLHCNGSDNKGRSISIWIVVMRGKFDSCLDWPLRAEIKFEILSQNRREDKDYIKTFQSDPKNASFKKPRIDRNKAYGISKFCSFEKLREGSLLLDGSLYIRVTVTPGESEETVVDHPLHHGLESSGSNRLGNIDDHDEEASTTQLQTSDTYDDIEAKDLKLTSDKKEEQSDDDEFEDASDQLFENRGAGTSAATL